MVTFMATAFGAGFLASLSPCVYPMLPITLGYLTRQGANQSLSEFQKRMRVFSFFLGQVTSFTALGILAVQLGEIFGFSSQSPWVQFAIGVVLLLMAYGSVSESAQNFFAKLNSKIQSHGSNKTPKFFSGFFVGAMSALVASPCTSPVLGGVLTQISSQGDMVSGIFQMMAFSIGMSFLFLLLGLGWIRSQSLPKAGRWTGYVHRATTAVLILGALYYFWNFYQSWT